VKTLKDFEITKRGRARPDTPTSDLYDVIQVGELSTSCSPEQIRREAINWIKELTKICKAYKPYEDETEEATNAFWKLFGKTSEDSLCEDYYYDNDCRMATMKWIMHFFNIKEEEIK